VELGFAGGIGYLLDMRSVAEALGGLALLGIGEAEIFLIVSLTLILARGFVPPGRGGSKLTRGFRRGLLSAFLDKTDELASDAGRSAGGIYGKAAAQALTPDNKVAELYDPTALHAKPPPPKPRKGLSGRFAKVWSWIRALARRWRR
jgi:hypothetical protein